jgi:uncharacterized protein (UPF0276 family)
MSSLRDRLYPQTRCGIGLRATHVAEVIATHPDIAWVEVHAENYMGGGRAIRQLETVRNDYAVSLHGVGLSLGGAGRLNTTHMGRLRDLANRIEPSLVSEHLAWSGDGGTYLNGLLPLPYTEEALAVAARNLAELQDCLGRRVLIENPSAYMRYVESSIPEAEFLTELVNRTGCGLLCDVNNIFVSYTNLGGNPLEWLDALPVDAVGEIHLAGHSANDCDDGVLLIDDHGSPVAAPVWALYDRAAARFSNAPALIEWDSNLPPLEVLLAEAHVADRRRAARIDEMCHAAA